MAAPTLTDLQNQLKKTQAELAGLKAQMGALGGGVTSLGGAFTSSANSVLAHTTAIYKNTVGVNDAIRVMQRGTALYGTSIAANDAYNKNITALSRSTRNLFGEGMERANQTAINFYKGLAKHGLEGSAGVDKLAKSFALTERITGMSADRLGEVQTQLMGIGKLTAPAMDNIFAMVNTLSQQGISGEESFKMVQDHWQDIMSIDKKDREEYMKSMMATSAVYKKAGVDFTEVAKAISDDPMKQLEDAAMISGLGGEDFGKVMATMNAAKAGNEAASHSLTQMKLGAVGGVGVNVDDIAKYQAGAMDPNNFASPERASQAIGAQIGLMTIGAIGMNPGEILRGKQNVDAMKGYTGPSVDDFKKGAAGWDTTKETDRFGRQQTLEEKGDRILSQSFTNLASVIDPLSDIFRDLLGTATGWMDAVEASQHFTGVAQGLINTVESLGLKVPNAIKGIVGSGALGPISMMFGRDATSDKDRVGMDPIAQTAAEISKINGLKMLKEQFLDGQEPFREMVQQGGELIDSIKARYYDKSDRGPNTRGPELGLAYDKGDRPDQRQAIDANLGVYSFVRNRGPEMDNVLNSPNGDGLASATADIFEKTGLRQGEEAAQAAISKVNVPQVSFNKDGSVTQSSASPPLNKGGLAAVEPPRAAGRGVWDGTRYQPVGKGVWDGTRYQPASVTPTMSRDNLIKGGLQPHEADLAMRQQGGLNKTAPESKPLDTPTAKPQEQKAEASTKAMVAEALKPKASLDDVVSWLRDIASSLSSPHAIRQS